MRTYFFRALRLAFPNEIIPYFLKNKKRASFKLALLVKIATHFFKWLISTLQAFRYTLLLCKFEGLEPYEFTQVQKQVQNKLYNHK